MRLSLPRVSKRVPVVLSPVRYRRGSHDDDDEGDGDEVSEPRLNVAETRVG